MSGDVGVKSSDEMSILRRVYALSIFYYFYTIKGMALMIQCYFISFKCVPMIFFCAFGSADCQKARARPGKTSLFCAQI